ncbi:MAG: hypothetical protein J5526_01885 [Bacteroidales bacterium]|nr:hypothetical protein [Bacteroidales bacterium]
MEQFYPLQNQSTNTSLKTASAMGPSKRVLEVILGAAEAECSVLCRVGQRQRCFQQIRFDSVRMEVCLN